ncbi:unnamed protein product (macronuclear) [Paramecium tetraurelia]|uniref:Uncharacterized protein n=1 Tax=Paramecium tetraurelia TaxID=5888 RepID=A0EFT9_PARTE|nr:uncharacterized protein GSPATT00026503001 [Paramecium tetraurelia]CAK94180.1 unnamed protein product [Paramecium tetraurelia]|eukprot:XP_001461553.1 hypothetical protein (macronuclear) [Paramecium tetraurelia strain d4-2]
MNNKQFKKKRLHEVDYAQKVLSSIKPDIQNIKLNQNLFHAQQLARHSSTLIKNIQKDVKQTLRKYDSQLKLCQSNRNYTMSDSARKYSSEIPKQTQLSTEKELESLKQQQKILMTLLNNLQQQEKLIVIQHQNSEEQQQKQCIEKQWYEQKEKQLYEIKQKQSQIGQAQKKKMGETDVIQLDISRLKRSPHNKSNSSQNFFSPINKDKINQDTPILRLNKSHQKYNQKKLDSPKKWEQYGMINKKNNSKNQQRNEKNQLTNENYIQKNNKQKQELQIRTGNSNARDSYQSKQLSDDLTYLINDLNEFNNKSKRFSIKE